MPAASSSEHVEMMRALKEPPVARFTQCSVEELSMLDIPVLLADYKRLAKLNGQVRGFFDTQGLSESDM